MATVAPGRPPRPLIVLASAPRVAIVEGRFYDKLADAMADGATRELRRHGAAVERVAVPGAFEIPGAIAVLSGGGDGARRFDGFVALGCVIRGETSHYDYVCGESARGLMDLSVRQRLAIGYGILTVENEEQAWARAAIDRGDKGGDAAYACLAMVALRQQAGLSR